MADLIAQGPQPNDRWRRKLVPGVRHILGRQAGAWSIPWDDRISRQHVEIVWNDDQLHVTLLEGARNPAFFRGHKSDDFQLRPGDHFAIGQTTFSLTNDRAHVSLDLPKPADERTFTIEELRRQPFREAAKRIDILTRLPDLISGAASDQELFVRLVNLLLTGIDRATAAAIVTVRQGEAPAEPLVSPSPPPPLSPSAVTVLHWDRRLITETDFRPSERLIRQAIESNQSIAHVWSESLARSASDGNSSGESETPFTLTDGLDWAFCTPVPGRSCAGWALYVAGTFAEQAGEFHPDPELLRDEVKFTELTATTLSALRESRILATRQASLSQFFSPLVIDALASQDADQALAPREADVTVLFCDLRGFTQQSERSAGDLFGLLERVSQALGVMTRSILDQGGVVGDFHGDAAMGFWGWPLPQPDAVERACRAALGIQAAFALDLVANFRVGIGIASGRAVAGKIGTVDQVKVTVFGPVVNLASRLETMTRQLPASILIDPPTAAVIRATVPKSICRVRRLALVRPLGLTAPIEVSELLPPPPLPLGEGQGEGMPPTTQHSPLTDAELSTFESASDAFQNGDWPLALKLLNKLPPTDPAKAFLTLFITRHGGAPPPQFDGSIPLEGK